MKKTLDVMQLEVETFPVGPDDAKITSFTGSTGYCCDTFRDCSTHCRQPTNVCEICF